jgi:hypothetical protein
MELAPTLTVVVEEIRVHDRESGAPCRSSVPVTAIPLYEKGREALIWVVAPRDPCSVISTRGAGKGGGGRGC